MFGCFFFSSRRRHTRSDRDWSSDVCSSDLGGLQRLPRQAAVLLPGGVLGFSAGGGGDDAGRHPDLGQGDLPRPHRRSMLPLTESGAIRNYIGAGARYRAPAWLLAAARREGGSPSLSLMACWTCSLPGRESTVITYSLRRKISSTGLVFPWYSRSRTASASSVSSSRLISSPPQASHLPSLDGLLSIRL